MRSLKIVAHVVWIVLAVVPAVAQDVIRAPKELISLQSKWNWALSEVSNRISDRGRWIAYSIDRLMGERSWIGSSDSFRDRDEMTLLEILTGERIEFPGRQFTDDSVKEVERGRLSKTERKRSEKKVLKEVVFLFEFWGERKDGQNPKRVRTSNISLVVDLEGLPVVWLGRASDEESIILLERLFDSQATSKGKQMMVQAIGIHNKNPRVRSFLQNVLQDNQSDRVREDAAFWLGQQDDEEAMKLLVNVARKDGSRRVAEQAVFALSQMSLLAVTDTLIELARNAGDREVRKKSVFWLGQRASEKVVAELQEFAYDSDDHEIQKQAVFALSQLKDGEGVTQLIRIAKSHPRPNIRKQAVFWLGQCDDPRAFEAIVEIATGKKPQ